MGSTDPEAQGDRDRWVPRSGSEGASQTPSAAKFPRGHPKFAAGPLPLALPLGAGSDSEEEPRFFLFTAAACLARFCSTSPS